VNRAGGRSGSLRNIGRIEQWNVGSGAILRIRRVPKYRQLSAESGHSSHRYQIKPPADLARGVTGTRRSYARSVFADEVRM
jgi:hypothetical protein